MRPPELHRPQPSSPPRRALILFTSHPVKEAQRKQLGGGNVEKTQQIYRAFLGHLLKTITAAQRQTGFDIIVASDEADQGNIEKVFRHFPGAPGYTFLPHAGSRFGEKFEYALDDAFHRGYQQVAIIGNDCLDLTPQLLNDTFCQLVQNDVVLGPAADGGFYLLGLNAFTPALFREMSWCGATVFSQISANIARLKLSLNLLPCLADIDDDRDLKTWLAAPSPDAESLAKHILIVLLALHSFHLYYQPPFLPKTHLSKRLWQKPPPEILPTSPLCEI